MIYISLYLSFLVVNLVSTGVAFFYYKKSKREVAKVYGEAHLSALDFWEYLFGYNVPAFIGIAIRLSVVVHSFMAFVALTALIHYLIA